MGVWSRPPPVAPRPRTPATSSPSTPSCPPRSATSATRCATTPPPSSPRGSATGTSRTPCRATSPRAWAPWACSGCTSRATAAPAPTPPPTALACRELEAVDSGLRSFVSVQGSLAMFAIHRWGSEEHKQQWLPRMATGDALGCFGLTESDAGSRPRLDADPRPPRRRRLGARRHQDVDHQRDAGRRRRRVGPDRSRRRVEGHPGLRRPHRHPGLRAPTRSSTSSRCAPR